MGRGRFLSKTSLREFSWAAGAFCRKRRFASFLGPRALFVENVASRVFLGRGRFWGENVALCRGENVSLVEFSVGRGRFRVGGEEGGLDLRWGSGFGVRLVVFTYIKEG